MSIYAREFEDRGLASARQGTVSWDYDSETVLEPGEIIPVTVTVSAPSSDAFIEYILENEIQGFNFAIHFVATE